MDDLKALFTKLGFTDIQTYIQSGNVIFRSSKMPDMVISEKIEQAIQEKFDYNVPVILRTVSELKNTVSSNPYYDSKTEDIDRLHLTFLKKVPSAEGIAKAESGNYVPDEFKILEKDIFLYCSGKYSASKLSNSYFESKLKVSATTRNWKTVLKLLELAEE